MKILVDMNLSPAWVKEFEVNNISAVHWSNVGKHNAPDSDLILWAWENDHVIFTHDLDFGTALALSQSGKPSVIQVRTQNVTILHLTKMVINAVKSYSDLLENGALIILEEQKERIRILPLS